MSVAQTAELIVRIIGQDALSPAVASAESGLGRLSTTSGVAAKSVGLVESAATGMGNALNHAKGFVSNLVSGPLGMIGLGAAAFTLGGALKEAIGTANDMASAIEKLGPLTGDTAEQVSGLIAVFNKFGIDTNTATARLAFMEKAVGNLTVTTKKASDFQKEFGFSLTDASGKVKDANTLILQAADYWNGSASASEKAALEAKLFGRGFADMIPILNLGSKGILDAEAAAASLGLTLNATNVQDLQKYQQSMRDAGEAVDGLKLQLALDLIPTITDLANTVTKFVTDHRTDIQAFFKGAIAAGKELGGALVNVGTAIVGVWNQIPPQLRDLLVEALIGNKVIKAVFGINIIGSVEGAIATIGKNLLGSLVGNLFGKTIATPVVNVDGAVVNVGGVGGAAGAEGAAAGGGGILTGASGALIGAASIAAAAVLIINANQGRQDLANNAAAGDPIAQRTQNELATRGLQNPNAAGGSVAAAVTAAGAKTVNELSAIKQDTAGDIRIGNAMLAEQKRATAHQASEKTISDIAGSNHNFLEMFRGGTAKAKIGLFPAEYNYLSTVSAQTKSTSTYVSGLKQDITALQTAEVTATNAQKVKLAADIVALQNLVKATTAAVYSVGLTPAQLTKLQNTKDAGSSIVVVPTPTNKQNTANSKAKNGGGSGAKPI